MGVTVLAGQAYVLGTPTGQDSQVLRARMSANYTTYTINSNSTGSTRYDWIYLQLSATNANTPDSAADNVITLLTSRSTSNSSDNGSPPTYGLLLAVVTVANGAASITNGNISDKRVVATIGATSSSVSTGWQSLPYALTYSANNGNKEFAVTTPYNITGLLSPGMKLNISRSTTPPTQCMAFASASSQYATKSSPSGLSFTSAFTCEAWIYPTSYTGSAAEIISRRNASVGAWFLRLSTVGQLEGGYGDGSGNFTVANSYQSVPLNQWTHVALVVSSVSSKTFAFYVNGTLVTGTSSLTAATTLVQSGNLSVGCYGAGTADFFNGYISEARVWSAAQTQTQIQNNMAINCVGNETNLVVLVEGNGNFNDLTSNANNLTATGGAIATQANNPYNAIEYAVVNTVSYSSPNTTITLDAGLNCSIPNQTLNSPQYSTSENPYGLPSGLSDSRVLSYIIAGTGMNSMLSSSTLIPGLTATVTIPSGGRMVEVLGVVPSIQCTAASALYLDIYNASSITGSTIETAQLYDATSNTANSLKAIWTGYLPGGSQSFCLGSRVSTSGGGTLTASLTAPTYLRIRILS